MMPPLCRAILRNQPRKNRYQGHPAILASTVIAAKGRRFDRRRPRRESLHQTAASRFWASPAVAAALPALPLLGRRCRPLPAHTPSPYEGRRGRRVYCIDSRLLFPESYCKYDAIIYLMGHHPPPTSYPPYNTPTTTTGPEFGG